MNMKNYRKRNFRRNSAGMNHTFAVLAVIFLSVFIVCGSVYLIFDFYSYYIAPALSRREVLTSADGSGGTASEILTGADALIWEADRLAIVLGTEGDGLAGETLADCDYVVKIPMSHGVDSLNVAAASAVAFWEIGRK